MPRVSIDGQSVSVPDGATVIDAARAAGIVIPTLCYRETLPAQTSCMVCVVRIDGAARLAPSCATKVREGMVIESQSDEVQKARRMALELLLSDHDLKCRECPANRNCALQKIAKGRGLKLRQKRFTLIERDYELDDSPAEFAFNRSRCVLCGQCVWADRRENEIGVIGFARRGINRVVTTFQDLPLAESICKECTVCVDVCPVGALYYKKTAE